MLAVTADMNSSIYNAEHTINYLDYRGYAAHYVGEEVIIWVTPDCKVFTITNSLHEIPRKNKALDEIDRWLEGKAYFGRDLKDKRQIINILLQSPYGYHEISNSTLSWSTRTGKIFHITRPT